MTLISPPAIDITAPQSAAAPEAAGIAAPTLNAGLDSLMLLADQAAEDGHYGFQDACLLLAEALSEFPSDAAPGGDLPALLAQWHDLTRAYRSHPGTATAGIMAFLRQPFFNLALADDEWALLAAQLCPDNGSEQCATLTEPMPAADDCYPADAQHGAAIQTLALADSEAPFRSLPRAVRDIVQLLLLETAALEACLSDIPAAAPATAAQDLQYLAEKTGNFGRIAQTAGFEGLAQLCEHVAANIRYYLRDIDAFNAEKQELLRTWIKHVQTYLPNFTDADTSRALITQLRNARWPLPLSGEEGAEISAQLRAANANFSRHDEASRATSASSDDVSLALPDDVNQELLEVLLQDLPLYTLEFSGAVQRLQNGGNLQDLDAAQRVAHTLKGSANTVGIRGIAVLTHHLEDILLACAHEEKLPGHALRNMLLEAADCLESMSESLAENGPPPANAVAVLQQVLDCANRLDREGFSDTDSSGIISSIEDDKPSPEGEGADALQSTASPPPPAPTMPESTVRVPSEQIENLLRIAGESVIANSQVTERHRRMQAQLHTLETQFALLQQRGAELERLIDVKDLSERYSGGAGKDFDALEMDQYNELHTAGRRIVEAAVDAQAMAQDLKKDLESMQELLEYQQRLAVDTQEALVHTRLAPAASLAPRLQRAVRQTCRLTGKQAELVLAGGDLLLDGNLLNKLADPLLHLLRNAVDHGLENQDRRLALGKAPCGTISLAFEREGNHILVRCRDDGRGLDFAAIRAAAEQRGALKPGQAISEQELQRFILRPHFSTRSHATQTSGRGIGMDAVYAQVLDLGGTLTLQSATGRGLSVELKLPLPLSRSHALLASAGRYHVAISTQGVEQILFGGAGEIKSVGQEHILLAGDAAYPLVTLETLLHVSDPRQQPPPSCGAILLVKNAERVWAVQMDAITASRDVVIKNMGCYVTKIPGIIGATILGDGRVTPVLDLPELLRAPVAEAAGERFAPAAKDETVSQPPTVLIVDDSLSQRRALEQLLADAGFRIRSARDGVEAAELLAQFRPAAVLTDLEMPRMNGIELTAHIRAQAYGKTLPVVMITSRTTARHRKMAETAGIDGYFAKPVRDDELLNKIHALLLSSTLQPTG